MRSIRATSIVVSMEVEAHPFTRGPKYDMDAYMATLLELRIGTCVASWVEKKNLIPIHNINFEIVFCIK